MQHRIFGRQVGPGPNSGADMKLVAIDEGPSTGASAGEPGRLEFLSVTSARQATRVLREGSMTAAAGNWPSRSRSDRP